MVDICEVTVENVRFLSLLIEWNMMRYTEFSLGSLVGVSGACGRVILVVRESG